MEVFGREEGLLFEEHYIIDNGEITLSEEREYSFDYDTDNEEDIIVDGFDNWGVF